MIQLRKPVLQDGTKIFQLAKSAGTLDVNSCYHYLLLCQKFSDTCVIATQKEELIGFLTAFRDPNHAETLFIWQIAVSQSQRNQGIARAMLNHLLQRDFDPEIQFIETTITPSNTASQALFRGLAKELQSEINEKRFFEKKFFSENGHEPENLFRIGPLTHNPKRQLYK
ncbi:MAG: diaminobutyrate acetyltransferase [Nitrospinaceae bacterium]